MWEGVDDCVLPLFDSKVMEMHSQQVGWATLVVEQEERKRREQAELRPSCQTHP